MKRKNPMAGAGCLPVGRACLAALTSCTQARCHPWGFGWSSSLPGTDQGLLGVDFAACEAIAQCGTSRRPMCPPGWIPMARVCCYAWQVRMTWRGCLMEGVNAAELVLVPAPLPASRLSQGASLWLCLAHHSSEGGEELVQPCLCLSPGRACESFSRPVGEC